MNPNDPLANLNDIQLPAAAAWWPPAPGWWLLAILLVLLLLAIRHLWKKRPHPAYRSALKQLEDCRQQYEQDNDGVTMAAASANILRRYALLCYPQENVAGLSGDHWLVFLSKTSDDDWLTQGRALVEAPWSGRFDGDATTLLQLVQNWIRRHRQQQILKKSEPPC